MRNLCSGHKKVTAIQVAADEPEPVKLNCASSKFEVHGPKKSVKRGPFCYNFILWKPALYEFYNLLIIIRKWVEVGEIHKNC
jgi:hypothetical protein